ncbi:MAG: DUF2161 family putative PD-(D/E)XK-type phosphodiesterase [Spirochaetaceae bacterium]
MILEVDISKPIEDYLESLGYKVRSEVKGCDITALKGEELLVIECKKTLSLKLIYQGVDRQEFCDNVYLALPIIDGKKIPNRKHFMKLLKRLELGLITVTFLKTKTRVDIVLDPKENKKRVRHKKRVSVLNEISERSGNYNKGGSVRSKLMTAYKERAIEIAKLLNLHGALSCSELKKLGTGSKTYSIIYKNFYGWFFKDTGYGKYGLTEKGKHAIGQFKILDS